MSDAETNEEPFDEDQFERYIFIKRMSKEILVYLCVHLCFQLGQHP